MYIIHNNVWCGLRCWGKILWRASSYPPLIFTVFGFTLCHCCSVAKSCPTAAPWTVALKAPLCPRAFPGKNIGVGCHFLPRGPSWTGTGPASLHCRLILYHWATREALTLCTGVPTLFSQVFLISSYLLILFLALPKCSSDIHHSWKRLYPLLGIILKVNDLTSIIGLYFLWAHRTGNTSLSFLFFFFQTGRGGLKPRNQC